MKMEKLDIYRNKPNAVIEQIPIFEKVSEFQKNYELIAKDLVEGLNKSGENPFIDSSMWDEAIKDTVAMIEKYIKQNDKKVLDLGCGTGRLLNAKCLDKMDRYGIDISIEMAKMTHFFGGNRGMRWKY